VLQRVLGAAIVSGGGSYRPGYNMGPGSHIPVLRKKSSKYGGSNDEETEMEENDTLLHVMKWGLIPSYTKQSEDGKLQTQFNLINARSEGLTKSGAFRRLLQKQRCVVVVDGFYEWEKLGAKKKQPYFIHTGTQPSLESDIDNKSNLLHLAALYDVWRGKGEEEDFSRIHHRMPVVLSDQQRIDKWLNCENNSFDDCVSLLSPFKKNGLFWYKVSEYVGNIRNKKAECLEPLEVVMKRRREKGIGRFFGAKTVPKKEFSTRIKRPPNLKETYNADTYTTNDIPYLPNTAGDTTSNICGTTDTVASTDGKEKMKSDGKPTAETTKKITRPSSPSWYPK